MRKIFALPIRTRIILLVALSLSASLGCYLVIARSLTVEDKISYIYDYSLSQTKVAAGSIENWMSGVVQAARLVAPLAGTTQGQKGFEEQARSYGVVSVAYLPPPPAVVSVPGQLAPPAGQPPPVQGQVTPTAGQPVPVQGQTTTPAVIQPATGFGTPITLGDQDAAAAQALVTAVGWTPQDFEKGDILVAPHGDQLVIGARANDASGQLVDFVAAAKLDPKILEADVGKRIRVDLFDMARGNSLLSSVGAGQAPPASDQALKNVFDASQSFTSGVRDAEGRAGGTFIVGYRRLAAKNLIVTSFISRDVAFAATRDLVNRSIVLGVSILLVAVGFALLSMRSLVYRIKQLVRATARVENGDFSVRVGVDGRSEDEVSALSSSFNAMAAKITVLIESNVNAARMEKELETAQLVQSRFFPAAPFIDDKLRLAGNCLPASECGGDWWFYAQVGHRLIVAVGDVTGHGASAALVTASAHGAFSTYVKGLRERQNEAPSPAAVVSNLNTAVAACGVDLTTMTFIASVIDLETGVLSLVNASHRAPYLYRKPADGTEVSPLKAFKPLTSPPVAQLGSTENLVIEPAAVFYTELEPGDALVWYTDGLIECTGATGEVLAKRELMSMLADGIKQGSDSAETACNDIFENYKKFAGDRINFLEDDVTLVVAVIPPTAVFQRAKAAA